MNQGQNVVKVGIGILIFKGNKVLLGRRKGSHGRGEHASPGGSLEFGESFEDCARREALEEASIEIENIRFLFLSNLRDYKDKHFVHVQLLADWKSGKPTVMEPEKCEEWDWYDLENLPQPLFKTEAKIRESMKTGRTYYD